MSRAVRNLLLALLAVGALAAAGHLARAAGQDPATPTATAPTREEVGGPGAEATPDPTPTPTPTPTPDAEEQLHEFVPSEKLPADQAVDFPVDI